MLPRCTFIIVPCRFVSFDAKLLLIVSGFWVFFSTAFWSQLIQSNSYSWEIIIYRLVLLMCLKKNLAPDGTLCSLQYVVMTTVCVMFSSLWYLSCGCVNIQLYSTCLIIHLYKQQGVYLCFLYTDNQTSTTSPLLPLLFLNYLFYTMPFFVKA